MGSSSLACLSMVDGEWHHLTLIRPVRAALFSSSSSQLAQLNVSPSDGPLEWLPYAPDNGHKLVCGRSRSLRLSRALYKLDATAAYFMAAVGKINI